MNVKQILLVACCLFITSAQAEMILNEKTTHVNLTLEQHMTASHFNKYVERNGTCFLYQMDTKEYSNEGCPILGNQEISKNQCQVLIYGPWGEGEQIPVGITYQSAEVSEKNTYFRFRAGSDDLRERIDIFINCNTKKGLSKNEYESLFPGVVKLEFVDRRYDNYSSQPTIFGNFEFH